MDPLERKFLAEGEPDDDDLRAPHPDDVSLPDDDADPGPPDAGDGWRAPDAPPVDTEGMPETLRNAVEGNRRNTGPKGVIADYNREQRRKQVEAERKTMERDAMIRRAAYGVSTARPSESFNATKAQREAVAETAGGGAGAGAGAGADAAGSGSDSDLDEDDFMAEYRRKRMEQMKNAASRPTFGKVQDCDPFEFLDITEKTDARVVVVALLHEPYIPECQEYSKLFDELAPRHKFIKFIRFQPTTAKRDFDHISLPCLQVFNGGALTHSIIRIHDELGEFGTVDDLEWMLSKLGALDIVENPTARKTSATSAAAAPTGGKA